MGLSEAVLNRSGIVLESFWDVPESVLDSF